MQFYSTDLSARSSIKTRRINYDPVLELYYYKSTEHQIRENKAKTTLQESVWARGSKPLTRILINLLSRLCGILWSCPQALFPKTTQAGGFLVESRDERFYQFECQRLADY